MSTFRFTYSPVELPPPTEMEEEMEASALLANALKRMDGLIGDYKQPSPPPEVVLTDPLAISIATQCETLKSLIREWVERGEDSEGGAREDPRAVIPPETKEILISWLGNERSDTPLLNDQLQKDKEELLRQVLSLREELESCSGESKTLKSKVSGLEKKIAENDQHNSFLTEELKALRATLQAREAELKNLQDEVQASLRGNRGVTPPRIEKKQSKGRVTRGDSSGVQFEALPRRNSFKRALVKAFGRKKAHTATLNADGPIGREAQPLNPRAAAFYALTAKQLASWFQRIGLEMYADIIEHNIPSGERLATMISSPYNDELVNIGILSTLHCKKLRLAVDEALHEYATPLEHLDHRWVAEWLRSVGLSQYQRHFHEGRIDGRMLNFITHEDLNLLEVLTPFHLVSLKRAIQAFRMCGYDKDYLVKPASDRGSMKLLHWSAQDVADWVRAIELDSYVGGLENAGIHGAVMLLDVQFTSESLAYALGIGPSKALICKHLAKKFTELIGPIAAQRKMDAMQTKGFQSLDPTEPPRHRGRSRSFTSKKGKQQQAGEEDLLCPLQDFPVIESSAGRLGSVASVSSATPPPEDVLSPDTEPPPTP